VKSRQKQNPDKFDRLMGLLAEFRSSHRTAASGE
jgi:hypothetical protein